jgi:prepilin-type N-terminal cleavage/methylation domain-containing protein
MFKQLAGKFKKGFTLVELLVVIAIIGILSSVVVVSLNSARSKARDTKRVADISNLRIALETYNNANSQYPQTLSVLKTGGYISDAPADPQDGTAYSYAALGSGTTCSSYHLGDILETAHSALSNDTDASNAVLIRCMILSLSRKFLIPNS